MGGRADQDLQQPGIDAGAARAAEAVVWRKLDGNHELTMWKWLESKSVAAPAPQPCR